MTRTAPHRFTSDTCWNRSILYASVQPNAVTPALLIAAPIRPAEPRSCWTAWSDELSTVAFAVPELKTRLFPSGS
jgi:hypothetical protein